eukprot:m.1433435 g.1433435  ORF g.1433435 m.1433435 type:complete len:452 (-) comp25080_c0_seq11:4744-6099(-)
MHRGDENAPLLPPSDISPGQIQDGGSDDDIKAASRSIQPPKTRRIVAVLVLISFTLHNAFNCWCFLNFANFKPVEDLMHVTAHDVAFMTTIGWIGILSTLPIVTVCSYRRVLLCIGGLLNIAAPVTRYIGAVNGSEPLVTFSQWLIGAAFGIIGAWPPLLASLQWEKKHHTLITAIASLANYVGGAIGTIVIPEIAKTSSGLLHLLRLQVYVAGVLLILMGTWLFIPPLSTRNDVDTGDDHYRTKVSTQRKGQLSLLGELRLCLAYPANIQIFTFGLVIGISLALQGMVQYILSTVGFADVNSGFGNAAYQLAAATSGILLGWYVTGPGHLRRVLRGLHVLAMVFAGGLLAVCWLTQTHTLGMSAAVPLMLVAMTGLGATLMGLLPFCTVGLVVLLGPVGVLLGPVGVLLGSFVSVAPFPLAFLLLLLFFSLLLYFALELLCVIVKRNHGE